MTTKIDDINVFDSMRALLKDGRLGTAPPSPTNFGLGCLDETTVAQLACIGATAFSHRAYLPLKKSANSAKA